MLAAGMHASRVPPALLVLALARPAAPWHETAKRAVDDFAQRYASGGMHVLDVGRRIVDRQNSLTW